MGYTKGNWETRKDPNNDEIIIGIKTNGLFSEVATVKWYGEDDCSSVENEANANLIAAAPELLESCKWALKIFELYKNHPQMNSIRENLREVITKTKGEK